MLRNILCICAPVVGALFPNDAGAYPDGAPWGSVRPSAAENCATCHFDSDAMHESLRLRIEGLPQAAAPGETYDLTIHFDDPDAIVAGFQLIAEAPNDQPGVFASPAEDVEFIGAAIRSIVPRQNQEMFLWTLRWQAPIVITPPIVFYVAASGANGDGSPLGDTIHFRAYELPSETPDENGDSRP